MGESGSSAHNEFWNLQKVAVILRSLLMGPLIQQNLESSKELEARWTTYLLKYFELLINCDWFNNYFEFDFIVMI